MHLYLLDTRATTRNVEGLCPRGGSQGQCQWHGSALPLYGIPFAIKDNIDLAGVPTTAACPAFAYTPQHSAMVVQRLIDAGAIPIGKTNLDQFATGLNGTRSPYGACHNAFNPDYISGGSSSGSAVALAKDWVCFSLGTDTAGSGRVPAAFNNIIGYKPTISLLSTRGVVPACRSLDCVSIFAQTAADAERILAVSASDEDEDLYSRQRGKHGFDFGAQPFRFGIPARNNCNSSAITKANGYSTRRQHACERWVEKLSR